MPPEDTEAGEESTVDRAALRKRIGENMTEIITRQRGMPFDEDDLRELFATLGKKYNVPRDARLVVRMSSAIDETDPAVKAVVIDEHPEEDDEEAGEVSMQPRPPKIVGVVLGFAWEWEETDKPKPPRTRTPAS
jgi:hypothetical protein